ncbi:L-serine ammonia-lyase [Methylovirgula sp. 4M-Z18]|uniref:L-serine ammonia-lyase n=1 Tax=Methylovirgula sp. 4M-Z18 TaxID=2293567 RepID=UPI000E2F3EA3|nr:L-serine ammonia-lyase [Methylovirgula sp. 4M-Z18]RFB78792.1 L-serine ammonia-lyase [Methylovirgula sp. 4M-Z18]
MISVFELFKVGIGPSSSHTVGPMKAAKAFADALVPAGHLSHVAQVVATLYGSLAWTGKGHGTDKAVVLGLAGEDPATVDPDAADAMVAQAIENKTLRLASLRDIHFDPATDIVFNTIDIPPRHPNTLSFVAKDAEGRVLVEERWCSVGGGFVVREGAEDQIAGSGESVPYPYKNSAQLLDMGRTHGLTIAEMVRANEEALRPKAEVEQHLARVSATMMACIDRGLATEGELPGGLHVKRRAKSLSHRVADHSRKNMRMPNEMNDRVSIFAIAVNEENAAGGRVVTAPTNGAAGVVPAVLRYYRDFCPGATPQGMEVFLLTATAVGALFKMNASISGAEVGCQGEVGVASSMAAAGLAAALGGSNEVIENAAEIGMEHHLGMTCDPIGGLVQIPCIERNAFGAIKAINAASLAMHGDGKHFVSLDKVIATMRQTGADMHDKYKETSLGGLAVSFIEC